MCESFLRQLVGVAFNTNGKQYPEMRCVDIPPEVRRNRLACVVAGEAPHQVAQVMFTQRPAVAIQEQGSWVAIVVLFVVVVVEGSGLWLTAFWRLSVPGANARTSRKSCNAAA